LPFASDTLGCIIKSAVKILHRRSVKETRILLSILLQSNHFLPIVKKAAGFFLISNGMVKI
jgi:hypothetical protein